jgi:serine/threonine protein kinase
MNNSVKNGNTASNVHMPSVSPLTSLDEDVVYSNSNCHGRNRGDHFSRDGLDDDDDDEDDCEEDDSLAFRSPNQPPRKPAMFSAGATMSSLASTTADEATILAMFSVQGATVTRAPRGLTIRIRVSGSKHNIWLKFGSELVAAKWEHALRHAASARVACLSDFEFLSAIGKGASGKVFLVRDRRTGEKLALKVIAKDRVFETRSGYRHALDERLALQVVTNEPFFTRLRYAFHTRSNFYLALDFYEGGDLYQYLRMHGGRMAEPQVRIVAAEVVLAIEHLHAAGFVFRDLKPENVLIGADGHVRLADFGLSKFLPPSNPLTATICGTYVYVSPEALAARHYGTSIDVWALGIFIYHIYRGRTPFEGKDLDQVVQKMNARQIRFPSTASDELVNLIKRLLDWQPSSRLGCGTRGVSEIRDHPFFAGIDWDAVRERAFNRDSLYNFDKTGKERHGREAQVCSSGANVEETSSPVSKASSAGRAKSVGSTSLSTPTVARLRSGTARAVTETSAPAEGDLLRNFCLDEWASVSIDNDFEDIGYGDQRLWPMKSVAKTLEDERLVVCFDYTSP